MKRVYIVMIGLLLSMNSPTRGADSSVSSQAWQLMASFSAGEALSLLEEVPPTPERQLAMATALLGKYPQTTQNVSRAEVLLKDIVEGPESSRIQAGALYLLGRIAHIFYQDRVAEAADYYRQLHEKYPEDQLADSATVKLALITLDNIPRDHSEREVQLAVEGLAIPRQRMAQSDFHSVLAEFYLEREDLSSALKHFLRMRELGASKGMNEANLLVQIGRVAEKLGETEISTEAYQTFLQQFPTDTRNYMVQDLLDQIATGGSR